MGFKLSSIATATAPSQGGFKTLEPGLYMAHIEDAAAKTASTGTEYINITFAVKDFEGNNKGKVWDSIFLTEKNAFTVGRFIKAIGIYDCVDLNQEITAEQLANLARKRDLLIETKIKPAEGNYKEKAVIDIFGTIGGYENLENVNEAYAAVYGSGDDTPAAEDGDGFINIGTEDGASDTDMVEW